MPTALVVVSEELPDGMKEIDSRQSGDLTVTLGWVPAWNGTVIVVDRLDVFGRSREWFRVEASLAMDAFDHPFVYMA